jgi:hypothetical protein
VLHLFDRGVQALLLGREGRHLTRPAPDTVAGYPGLSWLYHWQGIDAPWRVGGFRAKGKTWVIASSTHSGFATSFEQSLFLLEPLG